MGKTDMSYYKDLAIRIAGAQLGSMAQKTLAPVKGGSTILGAAAGSKFLKDKFTRKKKQKNPSK